jgi:YD repeat-containing protein
MKVTDSGQDDSGFKEINNTADDYVYDANGNMVWDRNKGGQEHLTNGSFDSGSSGWTITDANSRLNFNNGKVDVVTGANSSLLSQTNIVKPNSPHVVIIDITRTSALGVITILVGGTSQTLTTTGTYVLSVVSNPSNPEFRITVGTTWAGSINSVSLRGITAITYNFLNLPEVVSNTSEQMRYIYDATGRKLCQNVYMGTTTPKKATDYAGEFIYQNDTLQFINTEEGRIVMTGAAPEYQYHLKDHLGNVRMTFTATPEHEVDTATLENSHLAEDASKFLRVSSAKRVNAAIFDHTNGDSTGYSQRLNGSTDEKFGLARSISVMPGDTVKAEVYAKYVDPDDDNWDGLFETLVGQIAANASGVVYTGESYNSNTGTFPFPTMQATTDNEGAPKAYLNWLVFDRNYHFISAKSGYQQLTAAGKEAGSDVSHEQLSSPNIVITEPGYVYIYLSNEEATPVEVYFDDFKVTHTKSPVVQSDDYYPFGLSISGLSYQRENSSAQDYKYNGKELQDELGLGWLDYGARMYCLSPLISCTKSDKQICNTKLGKDDKSKTIIYA